MTIASLIAVVVGGLVYLLPSIVASVRRVPNATAVGVVNVFLGWTFVGWVVALAMAMRGAPPRL